jgi:mRNA interferase MazF
MVKRLRQGDIVYTDLFPTIGHEQSGMRPVIVLNNISCDAVSNMTIAAPITSTNRNNPTQIELTKTKTKGYVLCDQIRALDLSERSFTYTEACDDDTLWEIVDCVTSLIEVL